MCRAGKDNTRRYCPATNDAERVRERNARRRLRYMRDTLSSKKEQALSEGLSQEEIAKQIGFKQASKAYQKHVAYAQEIISKLRRTGKETHLLHAGKTKGGELVWSQERATIHAEIIREQIAKWEADNVPCNGEAIFSGGLGGAGKSTVLKKYAGIDMSQYATLNPDDIKEVLAEKGLIPELDGLSPMEASPLVHEEASYITAQLAQVVMGRKMNVIFDLTMASYRSTKKKIDNLRDLEYDKIDAVFVDISTHTSDERGDKRHLRGHNSYLRGEGNGGRLLPRDLTAAQTPVDPKYRSLNTENYLKLKAEGAFDSTVAYDNDVSGRDPILLDL